MKPLILLAVVSISSAADLPIRGFAGRNLPAHRELEHKARSMPDPKRISEYIRRMSAEPHEAGSAGSKKVAEYAAGLMKGWGLNARIEEFRALLPKPKVRVLEMISPVRYKAELTEPPISDDEDSRDDAQVSTFNAYSPSGDVTADLVYVNYGLPADYEYLERQGIPVKGRIVLARYGGGWRGIKPKLAGMHGAIGCIMYSDPRDGGYFSGDVYPKGAYRPAASAQRGSVMQMELYPGDPLSPGWANEEGAKQLSLSEAKNLAAVPVLPIAWSDAKPLLENLGGPVPPESWRGALPLTYHVGPGPAKVRLALDFDWSVRPIYDVVATVPGSVWPDEWILYGNHHDAWVNGAEDPGSGAAVVLETARSLAELLRQGWKPKRTIVLALWDGEEYGLVGSTEWAEKHADELSRKAVAYLNTDMYGRGPAGASGSHSLERFLEEVFRDVTDPETKKSILERSHERRRGQSGQAPAGDRRFRIGAAGAGSDYVAFLHRLGIASLNIGSGGAASGGVYHSIYDSFHWFSNFGDPGFEYGRMMAQLMTTAALRLADADILPFEFASLARTARGYADEIAKEVKDHRGAVDLQPVLTELSAIERSAKDLEAREQAALENGLDGNKQAAVNQRIYRTERALLGPGLPGRDWYHHQLYAPGWMTGYAAKTLPGIREAAESESWTDASKQVKPVVEALRRLRAELEQIVATL